MTLIYTVLQFTWGLIQNILGVILLSIYAKAPHFRYHGAVVTRWNFHFSMGLGMFIFLTTAYSNDPDYGKENAERMESQILVHEFGHTVQSAVLGPLFMFVIAIPSCLWAFLPWHDRLRKEGKASYFDAYCESWANAWGEKITGEKAPSRETM